VTNRINTTRYLYLHLT